MPMERNRYSENWEQIALQVKETANWQCQDCGKQCRRLGESLLEFCDRLLEGNFRDNCEFWSEVAEHPQRWTLTVAHLDQNPGNDDPTNLKALCAPCHLKHDAPYRQANAYAKRERRGQLSFEMLTPPNLPDKAKTQHESSYPFVSS